MTANYFRLCHLSMKEGKRTKAHSAPSLSTSPTRNILFWGCPNPPFTDDHEAWILTHMLYHGAYQHLWMWIQIQILLLEEQSKQCTGKYLSNNSLWIPLFFLNHIGMLQTPPQIHYNQSDQAGDTESTLAWTGRWGRRHNLQLFSPGTQVTEKHQEQV